VAWCVAVAMFSALAKLSRAVYGCLTIIGLVIGVRGAHLWELEVGGPQRIKPERVAFDQLMTSSDSRAGREKSDS
jgi:hypothetical protein